MQQNQPNQQKTSNNEQNLFSALTWGHNDQRLFVACSSSLHILRVYKEIPKFSLLAQLCIKTHLKDPSKAEELGLQRPLVQQIKHLFSSTIKVCQNYFFLTSKI